MSRLHFHCRSLEMSVCKHIQRLHFTTHMHAGVCTRPMIWCLQVHTFTHKRTSVNDLLSNNFFLRKRRQTAFSWLSPSPPRLSLQENFWEMAADAKWRLKNEAGAEKNKNRNVHRAVIWTPLNCCFFLQRAESQWQHYTRTKLMCSLPGSTQPPASTSLSAYPKLYLIASIRERRVSPCC